MDDLELASDLVREAGTLAARMLAGGLDTDYKTSISDVVSAADHAAEKLVAGRLTEERPDDGLVGEEGARRPGARTWLIDPVDGTYNFLSGIAYWCSAVGLRDEAGPLLGAVYYPATDVLWAGGREHPTTENGRAVARLTDRPLGEILVATYSHPTSMLDPEKRRAWDAIVSRAATVRMLGSASIDLGSVASGRIGLFLQVNLKPWDWFPGAAVVEGAGGRAVVIESGSNRWHLAGNAQAVAEAEQALRDAVANAV